MSTSMQTDAAEAMAPIARRTAMQGLAGLAAFGTAVAMQQSSAAKKKGKKKTKGTLKRVEIVSDTQSVAAGSTGAAFAECPAAGSKEDVFILGGGTAFENPQLIPFNVEPVQEPDEIGFLLEANNIGGAAFEMTARAVCAYFRK